MLLHILGISSRREEHWQATNQAFAVNHLSPEKLVSKKWANPSRTVTLQPGHRCALLNLMYAKKILILLKLLKPLHPSIHTYLHTYKHTYI